MNGRLLVVDDEPDFLHTLATALRGAGYEVETAATARSAVASVERLKPDALVLDLVLPDGSGVEVCTELRAWTNVPIVVVSAVGEEEEKVAALDAGADDYVTKPFALAELEIDREAQLVRREGRLVHLTPHEFDLLRVLAENQGKLLTHNRLLREVWGPAYQRESNYLHVYVSQLRRKIELDPARPQLLVTAPGAGYRLLAPES
jgi:two-component system, OmpR family, KDP operon response regulator KdpE